MILQFRPAAKVLPQGLVLVVCAKSPITTMLLMFSVAVPLLLSTTVFPALVAPNKTLANVREVGDRLTAGARLVTVRLNTVVCVKLPDTPWMVAATVPVAAVPLAVRVSVLVEVAGFVLKPAVTPLGRPEALKVTPPLKP